MSKKGKGNYGKAEKKIYGTASSSASSSSSLGAKMQATQNRFQPKPSLAMVFKNDPVWGNLAAHYTEEADQVYKVVGHFKNVFIDDAKDSGTVYVEAPVTAPALQELYEMGAFQETPIPFKQPWTINGNYVTLKAATPYGESAKEFFKNLVDESGYFMQDIDVGLTFIFKPYTQFPDKMSHGVSCKLSKAVEFVGMHAEPSQDPDA